MAKTNTTSSSKDGKKNSSKGSNKGSNNDAKNSRKNDNNKKQPLNPRNLDGDVSESISTSSVSMKKNSLRSKDLNEKKNKDAKRRKIEETSDESSDDEVTPKENGDPRKRGGDGVIDMAVENEDDGDGETGVLDVRQTLPKSIKADHLSGVKRDYLVRMTKRQGGRVIEGTFFIPGKFPMPPRMDTVKPHLLTLARNTFCSTLQTQVVNPMFEELKLAFVKAPDGAILQSIGDDFGGRFQELTDYYEAFPSPTGLHEAALGYLIRRKLETKFSNYRKSLPSEQKGALLKKTGLSKTMSDKFRAAKEEEEARKNAELDDGAKDAGTTGNTSE